MEIVQAIVLGIVQGLTEFLPISSSAHLIIVPLLLGWPQPGLAFDMALHLGTLVAVVGYFWRDLSGMALALPRALTTGRLWQDPQARLALLIVFGCLPAGVAGLLLERQIEATFYSDSGLRLGLVVIAVAMLVMAGLLWLADRSGAHGREVKTLTTRDALVIGLAQALALVPGVSRSGSTITAGLFVGLSRAAAARYSFLLGTPIIAVAAGKQLLDLARVGLAPGEVPRFAVGFLVSAIVGFLCIKYLLRYLQTRGMGIFVAYRLVLGVLLLAYALAR